MKQFLQKLVMPLVTIVAVVGLLTIGYFSRVFYEKQQETNASKVATSFIADMTSGNTDAAYALTGSNLHQQPKALMVAYLGDLKADKPKLSSPEVFRKGGDIFYSQKVDGLPKTKSGQTDGTFSILLHKEKAGWRVTSVSVK